MAFDVAVFVVGIATLVTTLGTCLQSIKMRNFHSMCCDMQMGSPEGSIGVEITHVATNVANVHSSASQTDVLTL